MSITWTIILLLITIHSTIVSSKESELLSVTVLFRHGFRTPRRLYKNDPYKHEASKIWPEGLGELTNIGKRETFALGQWYREKYRNFIPEIYNSSFLRVLSSNKDRCLMSAACSLAGLYPPKKEQIWNENLQWQPIPIHTRPVSLDGMIAEDDRPCKKYDSLYQELMKSENSVNFFKSKSSIFEYVSNHTGDAIRTFRDLSDFHDTLFIEQNYNLTLPNWTKKVFPHKTSPLVVMRFAIDSKTVELGRLKSGLLLDYITTFFEDVLRNPATSQKFLMISTHDSTIARLLNILGAYDYTWPEYASTLVFELRRNETDDFLRIYFKDSKKIRDIKLPRCSLDCNFDDFKNITKVYRINDEEWKKECASD